MTSAPPPVPPGVRSLPRELPEVPPDPAPDLRAAILETETAVRLLAAEVGERLDLARVPDPS